MGTLFLGHLNIVTGSHGNRDELNNKLHKYVFFLIFGIVNHPNFWVIEDQIVTDVGMRDLRCASPSSHGFGKR